MKLAGSAIEAPDWEQTDPGFSSTSRHFRTIGEHRQVLTLRNLDEYRAEKKKPKEPPKLLGLACEGPGYEYAVDVFENTTAFRLQAQHPYSERISSNATAGGVPLLAARMFGLVLRAVGPNKPLVPVWTPRLWTDEKAPVPIAKSDLRTPKLFGYQPFKFP